MSRALVAGCNHSAEQCQPSGRRLYATKALLSAALRQSSIYLIGELVLLHTSGPSGEQLFDAIASERRLAMRNARQRVAVHDRRNAELRFTGKISR